MHETALEKVQSAAGFFASMFELSREFYECRVVHKLLIHAKQGSARKAMTPKELRALFIQSLEFLPRFPQPGEETMTPASQRDQSTGNFTAPPTRSTGNALSRPASLEEPPILGAH